MCTLMDARRTGGRAILRPRVGGEARVAHYQSSRKRREIEKKKEEKKRKKKKGAEASPYVVGFRLQPCNRFNHSSFAIDKLYVRAGNVACVIIMSQRNVRNARQHKVAEVACYRLREGTDGRASDTRSKGVGAPHLSSS